MLLNPNVLEMQQKDLGWDFQIELPAAQFPPGDDAQLLWLLLLSNIKQKSHLTGHSRDRTPVYRFNFWMLLKQCSRITQFFFQNNSFNEFSSSWNLIRVSEIFNIWVSRDECIFTLNCCCNQPPKKANFTVRNEKTQMLFQIWQKFDALSGDIKVILIGWLLSI